MGKYDIKHANEATIVDTADAIIDPDAVMVKPIHTPMSVRDLPIALLAVSGSIQHIALAMITVQTTIQMPTHSKLGRSPTLSCCPCSAT